MSALLLLGSPHGEGQTANAPLEESDDRFFLLDGPSIHAVGSVHNFVHDTPSVITGAPYSGVGTTHSSGHLGEWGRATQMVKIRYLRDARGRMRREDVTRPGVPEFQVIRIDDPVIGRRYMLFPHKKTMHVLPFVKTAGTVVRRPVSPPPPIEASFQIFLREFGGDAIRAPGRPVARTIALGIRDFDGMRAIGERRAYTLPGKQEPIQVTSEQWFSPDLGVVMMNDMSVWVSSERNLRTQYRLHATRGEPDPALFRVPDDYVVRQIQ